MWRTCRIVIAVVVVTLFAGVAHGFHNPPSWKSDVLATPSADCIEVVGNTGETFSVTTSDGATRKILEIRNRCKRTVQFEVTSCRYTKCGDASCPSIQCSAGPYRIRPMGRLDAGDAGDVQATQGIVSDVDVGFDSSVPDTRIDPTDTRAADAMESRDAEGGDATADDAVAADADAPEVEGDATDASVDVAGDARADTAVDTGDADGFGSLGSAIYGIEDLGLDRSRFESEPATVVITAKWRLENAKSGTFRVRAEYFPGELSTQEPLCGCATAREGGLPVGPWALVALGLVGLRRWRD